ncbi:imelysin family protein [Alcanivorax sp. UBA3183]|uniref:imelysin family protein n=1 Tax=Alcanivorax sp. UBA3183 TaxID=1945980 RepID=UPI00257A657E|nr:imelysin family protein [Alcanivorax sp. UBA3183]|tara:strand:- start:174 stop:1454 length:1281 start_codon:yes stop_codon:yes gene_type:complete
MLSRVSTGGLLLASLLLSACSDEPAATPAPAYDEARARLVINHYADLALAAYSDALSEARELRGQIDALLAQPNAETLAAARQAWRDARVPYMQTEVFRFGNAVVDEWEGQVNAWPLDEGLIDYVADDYQAVMGNPGARANIIASQSLKIGEQQLDLSELDADLLASLNELGGSEVNVATGYHAIEFLLWGQDLNGTDAGAGERPATDFATGEAATGGHNDRRRDYLTVVTDLLISDLEAMVAEWQPYQDNYRADLAADSVENGLRKMLFGMGSLSLGELAGERMKVALAAHSPEDEHDCFSDNTHFSHFYNGKGIENVYLGEYQRVNGDTVSGPSLSDLVAASEPQLDEALKADLNASEAALQTLVDSAASGVHFDQLIAPGNAEGAATVNGAIDALVEQTTRIEKAALVLDIQALNPDTANHSF